MRWRLLILRSLDKPEFADRVAFAWHRLSNACHLHAFEMQLRVRKLHNCAASSHPLCRRHEQSGA